MAHDSNLRSRLRRSVVLTLESLISTFTTSSATMIAAVPPRRLQFHATSHATDRRMMIDAPRSCVDQNLQAGVSSTRLRRLTSALHGTSRATAADSGARVARVAHPADTPGSVWDVQPA